MFYGHIAFALAAVKKLTWTKISKLHLLSMADQASDELAHIVWMCCGGRLFAGVWLTCSGSAFKATAASESAGSPVKHLFQSEGGGGLRWGVLQHVCSYDFLGSLHKGSFFIIMFY